MPPLHPTSDSRTKPRRVPGARGIVRAQDDGGLRLGKPNYDLLGPGLADATRQQLPQLQSMITGLGALQSVNFKGVGPGGADIYQIKFEKGSLDYRIWLGADGKTENAACVPANSPRAFDAERWKCTEDTGQMPPRVINFRIRNACEVYVSALAVGFAHVIQPVLRDALHYW